MQVHFIRARSGSLTHPKAHKLNSEPKNWPKKAKIGENRRSAQVCGTPGPENAGPQPTRARKHWPTAHPGQKTPARGPGCEKNGSKIRFLCKVIQYTYISIFIQYFISVPPWSRGLDTGLPCKRTPVQNWVQPEKLFFLFFTFFPGLSQNINKTQS